MLFRRPREAERLGAEGTTPAAEILRKIRSLELRTRGLVESVFSGEHLSAFHGRGFEFSQVRAYQVGDDVRAIDWKVTARTGTPFIREFIEERDLLVVLMVDISGSGRFSAGQRSSGEVATEIAAALAFGAARNNDRLALLLVSDHVECFLPPRSGRDHVARLLADLLTHRARGSGTDLTTGFDHITRLLPRRSAVFVISDFIGSRDVPFRLALTRVARQHQVVAVRLSSITTDELPDVGWVQITDPETGRRVVINAGSRRVREHYRRSVRQLHAEIGSLLSEVGAELVDIDTAADPLAVLADFLRRRHRVRS